MITTNELHEVKPFSFMHTPGFRSWRTAGLNILKSYYLMSFACKEGRTWITQGMILWCEKDLLGFCSEASKSSSKRIVQITKLIAPDPGGAEIWTPISIKEIWQSLDDNESENFLIVESNINYSSIKPANLKSPKGMKKLFAIS